MTCGRRTRGTHRGEAAFRLCLFCYSVKNSVTILHNAGHFEVVPENFENCASPEEVLYLTNQILQGDIDIMPETHKMKGEET